jgi:hypothetical protein
MEPEPGNPQEIEGVLNPAAARGPDGELYLFPRLVARGNYSRIGIARVRFNEAGDPVGVERLGIALEPEADYELKPNIHNVACILLLDEHFVRRTAITRALLPKERTHTGADALQETVRMLDWRRHGACDFLRCILDLIHGTGYHLVRTDNLQLRAVENVVYRTFDAPNAGIGRCCYRGRTVQNQLHLG